MMSQLAPPRDRPKKMSVSFLEVPLEIQDGLSSESGHVTQVHRHQKGHQTRCQIDEELVEKDKSKSGTEDTVNDDHLPGDHQVRITIEKKIDHSSANEKPTEVKRFAT